MSRFLGIAAALLLFFGGIAVGADFREAKSEHFIAYYTEVPEDFVQKVLDHAERYYEELTRQLDLRRYDYWTWDDRAKIYLYPDQETFAREMRQPSWTGGVASYEDKTIWTFPRDAGFFDSLLPHEIGHIVFREVIGSRRVPLWLEEGVASYLEQAKRFGADRMVQAAMEDKTFIPFEELNEITPEQLRESPNVDLFYAESVSVVSFLIGKFGTERFNYMCEKIKAGRPFEDALAYAFFDIRSFEDLAGEWEKSLRPSGGRRY